MSDENPIYSGDGNRKKKGGSFLWVLLATILVFLVIAAGAVLFAKGSLSFGDDSKSGSAKTNKGANYTIVCDAKIIDAYNAAMYYRLRDGGTTPTVDEQGIKDLKQEIEGKSEYAGDPSCQAILFWIAVYFTDTEAARTAYDAEYAMHEDRIFADSNIRGNLALFNQLETLIGLESPPSDEL